MSVTIYVWNQGSQPILVCPTLLGATAPTHDQCAMTSPLDPGLVKEIIVPRSTEIQNVQLSVWKTLGQCPAPCPADDQALVSLSPQNTAVTIVWNGERLDFLEGGRYCTQQNSATARSVTYYFKNETSEDAFICIESNGAGANGDNYSNYTPTQKQSGRYGYGYSPPRSYRQQNNLPCSQWTLSNNPCRASGGGVVVQPYSVTRGLQAVSLNLGTDTCIAVWTGIRSNNYDRSPALTFVVAHYSHPTVFRGFLKISQSLVPETYYACPGMPRPTSLELPPEAAVMPQQADIIAQQRAALAQQDAIRPQALLPLMRLDRAKDKARFCPTDPPLAPLLAPLTRGKPGQLVGHEFFLFIALIVIILIIIGFAYYSSWRGSPCWGSWWNEMRPDQTT